MTLIPKGTIISGFPGIGKSTAARKFKNVIDLESSYYFFENAPTHPQAIERKKGDSSRKINPNGLNDYIKAIITTRDLNTYDYILIAQFPELLNKLKEHGIDVQIVIPENDQYSKDEYLRRFKDRGNTSQWYEKIMVNWDLFTNPNDPLKTQFEKPIMQLAPHESLSDIIDGEWYIGYSPKEIYDAIRVRLTNVKSTQLKGACITIHYDDNPKNIIKINCAPATNLLTEAKPTHIQIEAHFDTTINHYNHTTDDRYALIDAANNFDIHKLISDLYHYIEAQKNIQNFYKKYSFEG